MQQLDSKFKTKFKKDLGRTDNCLAKKSDKKCHNYIFFSVVGTSKQSPFWFSAVLDGNTIYTVAGDKLNNLDEFFNDTLGVKPSSESILALDPNKKYCTRVWLSANGSSHPDGGKN